MTKPDDIPQDVWDAAGDVFDDWRGPGKVGLTSAGSIARAIMAERERWQDKVDGLEADLYSALEVARDRGAREWVQLNYPGFEWSISDDE